MMCVRYVRHSSGKQDHVLQVAAIDNWLKGHPDYQESRPPYEEMASAWSHRPVWDQLLKDAANEKFAILIYRLDRWTRDVEEGEWSVKRARGAGYDVVPVDQEMLRFCSNEPMVNLMRTLAFAQARTELEILKLRNEESYEARKARPETFRKSGRDQFIHCPKEVKDEILRMYAPGPDHVGIHRIHKCLPPELNHYTVPRLETTKKDGSIKIVKAKIRAVSFHDVQMTVWESQGIDGRTMYRQNPKVKTPEFIRIQKSDFESATI